MKTCLICLLVVAIANGQGTKDKITVDPGSGTSSKIDWSKTDWDNVYCTAPSKECPGNDIAVQFAATVRQCLTRCSPDFSCAGVFLDKDKMCHMKSKRCTMAELVSNPKGTDYYRLKKGEKCPSDRPEFAEEYKDFTNSFCLMRGKSCPGHDLYPKPQNIYPLEKCLQKCTRIKTCASVDFKNNKCSPKEYNCKDEELVDDPGNENLMRLEASQTDCGPNRELGCPENSHAEGGTCVCDTNFKFKDGRCVPDCPPNSKAVKGKCECNTGFEMTVDKKCEKPIECPENGKLVSGKCECNDGYEMTVDKKCEKTPVCPPNSRAVSGRCQCDAGLEMTADNKCEKPLRYCRREYAECPGHDIRHWGAATVQGCMALCDLYPECKSLHYRAGNCWIKRRVCTNSELSPNTIGFDLVKKGPGENCDAYKVPKHDFCKRPMHYCSGGDIVHRHPVPKREMCELWCRYYPNCVSYHYKKDLNCWIERHLCTNDQLVPELPSADYVKVAVGGSCEPYQPKFKYCTRRMKECAGYDLEHRGGIDSLERCQTLCNYSDRCKTVHWREDRNCWLKYKVCTDSELRSNTQGYDSVKIQEQETCAPYGVPDILCPKNSKAVGGKCQCNDGFEMTTSKECRSLKYCRREYAECPGHDIRHMGSTTEEACMKLCDDTPECRSFHYRTGNCWIKRHVCANNDLSPSTTGVDMVKIGAGESCTQYTALEQKFCKRPMHYCSGGDIVHRHPVPKREMCELWCRYYPNCVSYHYKEDLNCWIERYLCTNDQLVPELPSADYVKVAVGGSCEPYQPKFKYCTRRMMECAGYDLEHRGGIDSLERCQTLCNYSDRCKTVHWREDRNCWLKYKVCTNNELTPNTQGYDSVKIQEGDSCAPYEPPEHKFCKRANRYCSGGDIHHRHPVPRRETCELWCRFYSNCVSYHYKDDLNCWLERRLCSNNQLVYEVPSNDYVKVDVGGSCAEYTI